MWKFSNGRFPKPNIPLYNWEELGKMDSSVLRTLRYITFGRYSPSYDGAYFLDSKRVDTEDGDIALHELDSIYPMLLTEDRNYEEWPSEKWNFQDNYGKSISKVAPKRNPEYGDDESSEAEESIDIVLDEREMTKVLTSVKGIGKKKSKDILTKHSIVELINILEREPKRLLDISWVKKNILEKVVDEWNNFKKKL
jgi:hypothetical protein